VHWENCGIPSVAVCSSAFQQQAAYQAEMLNAADVKVSFVRHPISDATPEAMAQKAEESFEHIVAGLEGRSAVAPVFAKVENGEACAT